MTIKSTITNVILRVAHYTKNKNFAIYCENKEVLKKVAFIDGSIDDTATVMEHPLENGSVISDHVVFNPRKATLSVLIDDDDNESLAEVNEYYENSTLLKLKAKGEMCPNMIICAKPFKLNSSYYDKTSYSLSFKAVQIAESQYAKIPVDKVQNPENSSTVSLGQISAKVVA